MESSLVTQDGMPYMMRAEASRPPTLFKSLENILQLIIKTVVLVDVGPVSQRLRAERKDGDTPFLAAVDQLRPDVWGREDDSVRVLYRCFRKIYAIGMLQQGNVCGGKPSEQNGLLETISEGIVRNVVE